MEGLRARVDVWQLFVGAAEPIPNTLVPAVLTRYTGVDLAAWRFGRGPHGKPKIMGPARFKSLRYNVSHTRGLVLCAVSLAGDIGVDVENTTRRVDVEQFARHFFSRSEQERLAALPERRRTARFFEQWVLREAYLKGTGKGLAAASERFTVKVDRYNRPRPPGNWHLYLRRPSTNHVAAVAVRLPSSRTSIPIRWLDADKLLA